jgi:hypothetical protein
VLGIAERRGQRRPGNGQGPRRVLGNRIAPLTGLLSPAHHVALVAVQLVAMQMVAWPVSCPPLWGHGFSLVGRVHPTLATGHVDRFCQAQPAGERDDPPVETAERTGDAVAWLQGQREDKPGVPALRRLAVARCNRLTVHAAEASHRRTQCSIGSGALVFDGQTGGPRGGF